MLKQYLQAGDISLISTTTYEEYNRYMAQSKGIVRRFQQIDIKEPTVMVLPVACAMQLARSYRGTVWASIGFAELFTISGLVIAYYGGLKPGGTIVLMGVVCLIGILIVKSAVERRQAKKA